MRRILSILVLVFQLAFVCAQVDHEQEHHGRDVGDCEVCKVLHAPTLIEPSPEFRFTAIQESPWIPVVATWPTLDAPAFHPIRGPPAA